MAAVAAANGDPSPPVCLEMPPLDGEGKGVERRRMRVQLLLAAALRLMSAVTAGVAVGTMVSAEEKGSLPLMGLRVPLYSKWSYSDCFEYLVCISAAAFGYSLLQFLMWIPKLLKASPFVSSDKHAWRLFAADQLFAYAMMSAASAAAGVTNLNRTGIRHNELPDFCKGVPHFCERLAVSITFAYVSCCCLAASAVVDVIWLLSLKG